MRGLSGLLICAVTALAAFGAGWAISGEHGFRQGYGYGLGVSDPTGRQECLSFGIIYQQMKEFDRLAPPGKKLGEDQWKKTRREALDICGDPGS